MSENFRLLRAQKNDIFKILEQAGLNPSDFRWGEVTVHGEIRLWHDQSGYFIEFSYWKKQECYFITCSPSKQLAEQSFQLNIWDAVLNVVKIWALCLKKEIDTPDLWAQMEKYTAYLSVPPTEDLPDEPISAVDATEIEDRLWLFADKVEKQFNLAEGERKVLRHQMGVLIGIAKRSSKKAFLYSAFGVIAGIAMSLAMSPEQAKALWQLLHDTLSPFMFLQ